MPLAFASESHGDIAFGFFNIETDMLLLERTFFFAGPFCAALVELARGAPSSRCEAWCIDDPRAVGDLHGAIAGQRLEGFLGATYRRWPFPSSPEGFKQQPEGEQNRDEVRQLIAPFARPVELELEQDPSRITVGEVLFTRPQLACIVDYVDRGGYPRWRDERRPRSVVEMSRQLSALGWP